MMVHATKEAAKRAARTWIVAAIVAVIGLAALSILRPTPGAGFVGGITMDERR